MIKAVKNNDAKTFNLYLEGGGAIIKAGEKVTITMCFTDFNDITREKEGFFSVKYKGKSYDIEQAAIF